MLPVRVRQYARRRNLVARRAQRHYAMYVGSFESPVRVRGVSIAPGSVVRVIHVRVQRGGGIKALIEDDFGNQELVRLSTLRAQG